MKKTLSLLLALTLCLSLLSASAFAADPVSGSCGSNATWSFDKSTGVLTISGTGAMNDYGWNSFPWYSCHNEITSVIVQDGITGIGEFVFYGCNQLASITLPSSVTSIGEYAFYDCTKLTSITLPNSVTSIGRNAFYNCGLTSVTIPSGVTSIAYGTFEYCKNLASVTIPSGVTSIGGSAFWGCTSLTSVDIPFGVTSIGGSAFSNCESLSNITIASSVTSVGGGAFSGTPWLASLSGGEFVIADGILLEYNGSDSNVTIPSNVIIIGGETFLSNAALTSITIPDSVTTIGDSAFLDCKGLTSITFGSGLKTIGDSAFRFCTGLTSVTLPNGLETIGDFAFHGCDNLKSATVPSSVTNIAWGAFSTHINSADYVAIPSLTLYGESGSYVESYARENTITFPFVATGSASTGSAFTDVSPNEYYSTPVAWAVEKGITTGTSATTFTPGRTCNNGEILTFLWRAYGEPKPTVDNPFTNLSGNEYYYKAALWAYEKGIVSGGIFNANIDCTRAMTVKYLWQAAGSPTVSTVSIFTDIPAGADYTQAVIWATQEAITTGTSATTFAPTQTCTRAQIVTFLYRNLAD